MSDQEEVVSEKSILNLTESKLYTLARTVRLMEAMVPEFTTQFSVETDLDQNFPRTEEDGDSTRILINYTNARGNSILYKLNNHERLNTTVDVDDFLSKYGAFMADSNLPEGAIDQMRTLILAALTFAVSSVLELDQQNTHPKAKELATWFLGASTTAIYDDPLDVVIAVNEIQHPSGQMTIPTIVAMWATKFRTEHTA